MKPFLYNMDYVNSQSKKKLFTVVSMFAGGGGSSTGYRLSGGNVLAINEFIDSAQETYNANYPNTYIFKEICLYDYFYSLSIAKHALIILNS